MKKAVSRIRSPAWVGLAIACLIVAAVVQSRYAPPMPYMRGEHGVDYNEAEAFWERIIRDEGAGAARQAYLHAGALLPDWQAHTLAHTFGAALYATGGIGNIVYCGSEYVYGCYHQLIGDAITHQGIAVAGPLLAACRSLGNTQFGCEHGIGHGLVGYLGYSLDGLKQALATCTSIDQTEERSGCLDGAFMEYNIRELASLSDAGHFIPRTLEQGGDSYPCFSLDRRYQPACVFELPDWWMAALPADVSSMPGRFARIGTYCASLSSDTAITDECFAGTGFIASAFASLSATTTESYCDDAASLPQHRLSCLSGATWRFRAANVASFRNICGEFGLTGDPLAYCEAFATSTPSEADAIPFPTN